MDIGSILILLSVLVLAGFFVIRPLLDKQAVGVTEEEQAFSALMAERDRILEAIEELEFDFNLGKIPEADFPNRRSLLYQQGAEILKQIDTYESPLSSQDDLLEAVIQARRQSEPGKTRRQPVREDDDIETLLAARRREKQDQSGGFCPQCGQAYQQSDKFCSKCGAVLS